jgi:hypothetical protein
MQASDAAGQALAVVALAMSSRVTVAPGAATQVLGDLISQRLSREGPGRQAWNDFQADPYDDCLVHRLLGQELEQDSGFREQLVRQLAQLSGEPPPSGSAHHDTTHNQKTSRFPVAGIVAGVQGLRGRARDGSG